MEDGSIGRGEIYKSKGEKLVLALLSDPQYELIKISIGISRLLTSPTLHLL